MVDALIIIGACIVILLIALVLVAIAVDETGKTITRIDTMEEKIKGEEYGR
jgi:cell division protein FtsL